MSALLWLAVALALVAFEMHNVAFYAIFGAFGAVVAAAVALVVPSAYPVQVLSAAVASAAGVFLARPYVSRAFMRSHGESAARGVHGGFVGEAVYVVDTVSSAPGGHVRLVGEVWLARTDDTEVLPAGSKAVVTAVTGTTLTVSAHPRPTSGPVPKSNLEQLRANYEHILDNRLHDSSDLPDGGDLRSPADDQHRPAG